MSNILKIGLIINPIAGMGGSVGLKGTDGTLILDQARSLGAQPHAPDRTREFFHELRAVKKKIQIVTVSGIMGGDIAQEAGFDVDLITDTNLPNPSKLYETTSEHTILAAKLIKNKNVALIVFVGGDGTARNIFEALNTSVPCLGIPGGVKIHSSVFAINPRDAGLLTLAFLWGEVPTREAEVLDIDEEAFRLNRVVSKLYGYLITPYSPTYSQPSKMGSPSTEDELANQEAIAQFIVEEMGKWGSDQYVLLGPGTTTRAIANQLHLNKTLLGVDLIYNRQIIAHDLNEQQILDQIQGKKTKLIVTPIGAQGFIFGRGNLQLSASVLNTIGLNNIIIIATKYKMSTIPQNILRIDSRDPDFDMKFKGLYRVLVDYAEYRIIEISN